MQSFFKNASVLVCLMQVFATSHADNHLEHPPAAAVGCARSVEHEPSWHCSERARPDTASNLYFGQEAPGPVPQIFAPGIISLKDRGEFASVLSADGTELIFGRGNDKTTEILSARFIDGEWSEPEVIVSHERYSYMDAFLSPDETKLYYISNQPLNGQGEPKDPDIWFSRRAANGWDAPEHAGTPLNSNKGEYYVSFTKSGTLYFTSNRAAPDGQEIDFDIHAAEFIDGVFQKPKRLSSAVNSPGYDGDVFVAPDESYLVFSSDRPDGYGSGDLYVSFRSDDGGWTKAKNLGPTINTEHQDYCPFVTSDGRYLFFSSNRDIYWVDASIVETYRSRLGFGSLHLNTESSLLQPPGS